MHKFRPLHSTDSAFLPEEPLGESVLHSEESLRVWQPKSRIVVLGRSQVAEKEVNLQNSRRDGIPIFKRHGGGGCVILDKHSLCVAIRYARGRELNIDKYLTNSCQMISDFIEEEYEVESSIGSNYDLITGDRKFLGSSLYMPKGFAIYSCVILFEKEAMKGINEYLTMPSKEPKHRQGRSHDDFLVPLQTVTDEEIETFRQKLYNYLEQRLEE